MEKGQILHLIGKRVKELRESKGLSQVDLVGRMQGEIDPTNISRIESGRTNPTIFTICRIAQALEIQPKEILEIEMPNF